MFSLTVSECVSYSVTQARRIEQPERNAPSLRRLARPHTTSHTRMCSQGKWFAPRRYRQSVAHVPLQIQADSIQCSHVVWNFLVVCHVSGTLLPHHAGLRIPLATLLYLFFASLMSSAESVLPSWASCHPRWNKHGCRERARLHCALKGFRRLAPPKVARWCMDRDSWNHSGASPQTMLRDEAALTLLCCGTYLRPSEGRQLRSGCLVLPEITVSPYWSLVLAASEFGLQSKTGVIDGSVLWHRCRRDFWIFLVSHARRGEVCLESVLVIVIGVQRSSFLIRTRCRSLRLLTLHNPPHESRVAPKLWDESHYFLS